LQIEGGILFPLDLVLMNKWKSL